MNDVLTQSLCHLAGMGCQPRESLYSLTWFIRVSDSCDLSFREVGMLTQGSASLLKAVIQSYMVAVIQAFW